MKLFQKTQIGFNFTAAKRLQLVYADQMLEAALQISIQSSKLTDFNSLFCLDISRDSSSGLFGIIPDYIDSYILRPSSWQEVLQGINEIQDFAQEENAKKTTLVLSDWTSLCYLANKTKGFNSGFVQDLLFQLKFLSDKVNIIILSSESENISLASWAQACLKMSSDGIVSIQKSNLNEWKTGQNINFEKPNIYPFPDVKSNLNINSLQSLNIVKSRPSEIYENLLVKLAESNSRQDLLTARKEIQSAGSILSSEEKIALSDIYKVHLQRVKLLEDNLLGSPLNIDVG